jgi:2-keto-4-pentenoate hydratase
MDLIARLAAHIDQPGIDSDPERDIVKLKPDISQDEALAVQLAVKRRRVAEGDRIAGHQASFTSAAIQRLFPDAPIPMVGTLLGSQLRDSGAVVPLDAEEVFIESELGVVLKRDLAGPDLCAAEIFAAIEGFLPAIEVAPLRPGVREQAYSWPHMIAVQKASGGYVVLGSRITAPTGFDPRLEGCVIEIDGEARAGATGFEAMGNPLAVVAAIARKLHAIGEHLHAGQLVITGSLPPPQVVRAGNARADLHFATLGSVALRFT